MEILENEQQVHIEPVQEQRHFTPHLADPVAALEHYHRYLFASRFAAGKRVLDVGCGDGYGTAFLSLHAKETLGVDCDDDAVVRAREKYREFENAHFEVGRCEEMNLAAGSFDTAVSFHVLEHLADGSRHRLLANLKNVLGAEGIAVISTAERHAHTPETGHEEPSLSRLSARELFDLLKRYFNHVIFVGQKPVTLSLTWSLHSWQSDLFSFQHREDLFISPKEIEDFADPVHLIAICSDAHLPRSIADASNTMYLDRAQTQRVADVTAVSQQLHATVEHLEAEMVRLHKEYNQSTEVVQRLYAENIGLKNRINQMTTAGEEQASNIEQMKQILVDRDDAIQRIESEKGELSARIAALGEEREGVNGWVRQLQVQLEEQALKVQESDAQQEKYLQEVQSLSQQLEMERTNVYSLKERFDEMQAKIQEEAQRRQLEEEKLKVVNQALAEKEHELESVRSELDGMSQTVARTIEEKQSVLVQIQEMRHAQESASTTSTTMQEENIRLQETVVQLTQELDDDKQLIDLEMEESSKLEERIKTLEEQIARHASQSQEVVQTTEALQSRNAELQKIADEKAGEATRLAAELEEQHSKLHVLQRENEQHKHHAKSLEETTKQRLEHAEKILRQHDEQKMTMRHMKAEMDKQTVAFDTFQKSQADLQQRYNKSQIKVQELQATVTMLEQKLDKISHSGTYKLFSSVGLFPKKDG